MLKTEGEAEEAPSDETFVLPIGFTPVPKPSQLPRDSQVTGLFIMMLWALKDDRKREWNAWKVGKVGKFLAGRTLHNYNILWDDGLRGSKLCLHEYFTNIDDETCTATPGEWLFLRKL
ncbi:hypothetical protein CYMTET_43038 [Cymbomonas tetramitiformis]|uniref:Uncharacterized protein n=1 Tax=Cymbomonas tetramitiformis TaxID=36881 RepID=A0AAE0F216_9CHLO|nr:hypothetical protein CYMTET_43038 [Cymbomonas tetramitiformis]